MLARTILMLMICMLVACSSEQANADKTAAWPTFEQPQAPPTEEMKPAAPLPRACSLVTEEQAKQVLNQDVGLMSDEAEACMWASADQPGTITMLMVLVSDNDDVAMAQEVFNSVTGMQGNLSALINQQIDVKTRKSGQEMEDLGDEAWLSASNVDVIGTQQLVVRKGTRILTLNVTGMGKTDGLAERLTGLARSAVTQL